MRRRRERAAAAAAEAAGGFFPEGGEGHTALSVGAAAAAAAPPPRNPPPPSNPPTAANNSNNDNDNNTNNDNDINNTNTSNKQPLVFLGFWRQLSHTLGDVRAVALGPERRAFWLLVAVAAANQGMASSAVVTFAPALLRKAGVASDAAATALSGTVSGAKVVGVAAALLLVDAAGRRPLATWGGAACSLSLAFLAIADSLSPPRPALLLSSASAFITAFSASHAGLFWVLASELFSMRAKPAAATAATASLFASGAAVNLVFLPMHSSLGGGVTFSVFAAVAASVAVLCYFELPETKGRTLAEVVEGMQRRGGKGGGGGGESGDGGRGAAVPAAAAAASTRGIRWWPPRLPFLRRQGYSRFGGGEL